MAKTPDMTQDEARQARDVLLEQERVLRYESGFGSAEALELGCILVSLASEFDETYVVTIVRAADGACVFQWLPDDKGARNLGIAAGKCAESLAVGHASPWRQALALMGEMALDEVFADAPARIAGCGAFPVRVGDEVVAIIGVSGLHNGLDHEVVVRALEKVLDKTVPHFLVALL